MSFETLQFIADQAPEVEQSPALASIAQAEAAERAQDAREAREAEDRRVAQAERMETLAIQNRALGDPLGQAAAARSVLMAADDKVADLAAQLERAQRSAVSARSTLEFYVSRAQSAQDCAQRSEGTDLLAGAKAVLKEHQEFVSATRSAVAAMEAGKSRQARRPKGHGGVARRSEVTCAGCKAEGIGPDESFLIHSDPDRHPGLDAEMDSYPEPGGSVQRRGRRSYREISR